MVSEAYRLAGAVLAVAIPALYLIKRRASCSRQRHFGPQQEERVLILGASSGVGHAIARQYARRGARVCVVARRADKINALAVECGDKCIGAIADLGNVEDMVRLRDTISKDWGGLDTIHVCAGVSALLPVMALTGTTSATEDASVQGIQNGVDIARRAVQGNFTGPLVAMLTFLPMLNRTSPSPSILLVSSMAALVPAPTRALYAATKASSLLLYQALAIEHRNIAFTFVLPATIEGDFRASAVDAGFVREADPNKHGLKIDYVAARCIDALDRGVTGNLVLPWFPYAFAHYMYYLWPSLIERQAAKKYNFA